MTDQAPQGDDEGDEGPGAQERSDEGMAPLVTNTGDDDDDGAATG